MAVECLDFAEAVRQTWTSETQSNNQVANALMEHFFCPPQQSQPLNPIGHERLTSPNGNTFEKNNMFSCWSPILDEKVDRSKEAIWSNVYNWMQNSSGVSSLY